MQRSVINVLYVNKQEYCASSWRSNQGYAKTHGQPVIKMYFTCQAYPSNLQTDYINTWKTQLIRLHVQYSIPDDEHKMFETCRRQEEFNQNIILKIAFCWLALQNGGKVQTEFI